MIHYYSTISKFDDKTNHVNSLYLCILSSLSFQITKALNIDVHIVNLFFIPRSKFSWFHSFFQSSTISHSFETLSGTCNKYMISNDCYVFTGLINVFFDPLLTLNHNCNLLILAYYLFIFYQSDVITRTIFKQIIVLTILLRTQLFICILVQEITYVCPASQLIIVRLKVLR